jgi:choline dehydrogenase-like flavoprotein
VSFIDAREMREPATIDTDICIVGAGAAGITLATQLLPTGRDICLIESGGFAPDAATQSLYDLESTGYSQRENYMSRARYFGGSCNLWAGRSMQLNPLDFEQRDWVPHSGWPIAYEDVAVHYPAAARILGLPDPELRERLSHHEQKIFQSGILAPTKSVWACKPMRFGATSKAGLRAARNLRVLLNVSATRLNSSADGGAIESIDAGVIDGPPRLVRARLFVLACGGLENARLLLASRDRQPQGVGNQYDLVGRYFMDHPRAVFGRIHVPAGRALPLLRGRPLRDGKLQLGIGLSPDTQRRERLLNHYVTFEEMSSGYAEASYQSVVQAMKVVLRRGHAGSRWDLARARLAELPEMIYLLSPKELMPHALYRAYVAIRDRLPRPARPKTYVGVYFCEQPPEASSRVTLGHDTDRLGMRRLSLHWHLGDALLRSVFRLQELLRDELESTGLGTLEAASTEPHFTDASHHIGTTRMSVDAHHGVVNTDCRLHSVRNLYIAGSSVFPCAGHANPTLTIVALALRLARHLGTVRA